LFICSKLKLSIYINPVLSSSHLLAKIMLPVTIYAIVVLCATATTLIGLYTGVISPGIIVVPVYVLSSKFVVTHLVTNFEDMIL
jgi:hypothetical protein